MRHPQLTLRLCSLVFMGSEKYPYKGIIDHFANRGFSNGTNAWTATDHTVYTVATAGAQGFLQLLPIYVDHILYPTITQAAYLTEVHEQPHSSRKCHIYDLSGSSHRSKGRRRRRGIQRDARKAKHFRRPYGIMVEPPINPLGIAVSSFYSSQLTTPCEPGGQRL